jgi:hypothetical protein
MLRTLEMYKTNTAPPTLSHPPSSFNFNHGNIFYNAVIEHRSAYEIE